MKRIFAMAFIKAVHDNMRAYWVLSCSATLFQLARFEDLLCKLNRMLASTWSTSNRDRPSVAQNGGRTDTSTSLTTTQPSRKIQSSLESR